MELVNSSINDVFTFLNNKIRVYGNIDSPWFCGRDVANILKYIDTTQALRKHVDSEDKIILKLILPTIRNDTPLSLTLNELNSIYINESGLYSLILRSKLESAKVFKKWVTSEVLPSIRKRGQYQIDAQIKLLEQQVEERDKEIKKQKTGNILLKNYVENVKSRNKESIIYIATSTVYASQNNFKVGGCASNKLLKSRLATYNSGRPQEDQLYYAALFKCADFRQMESRIKDLLAPFKSCKKNTEMYIMHYNSLSQIIEFINENYSKEIEKFNEFVASIIEHMVETEAVIPPPLKLDYIELKQIQNGETVKSDIIDLDSMDDAQQKVVVTELFITFKTPNMTTINRKDFESHLSERSIRYKKRGVWKIMKDIASDFNLLLKY